MNLLWFQFKAQRGAHFVKSVQSTGSGIEK
jgi:hypothetical protein